MDDAPFTCPYCETELQLPEDVYYFTCTSCGKRLDLLAQFAYLRGLDAFSEGQDLMETISPRQRRIQSNRRDRRAMELFMEAYSSLQLAFKAELEDSQKSLGIEMMSSMAQEFMKRDMVSMFEMNYWTSLMVELTAQREYHRLKDKLAHLDGPMAFYKRMRWSARQKKLLASLAEVDRKIKALEKQIDFIDPPRARNLTWKP